MTATNTSIVDRVAFALAFHAEKTTADIFGKPTNTATFQSQVQAIAYMYRSAAEAAIAAMDYPASLSKKAQIASMSLHAAPGDAQDGGDIALGDPECKRCDGRGYNSEGSSTMYHRGSRRTASLCQCALERMPKI